MNICEYTTLAAAKSTYTDIVSAQNDAVILALIRQASREIEDITNRHFYPRIEAHLFDAPTRGDLILDDDLLEITSLTNGDGTALIPSMYRAYPLNKTPKERITLLSSFTVWLPDPSGNRQGAITLTGVWGCHSDYYSAWETPGAALSAAITTSTATTAATATAIFHAGDLIKIDTEYLYIASLATSGATDTLTLTRGVNGSTAATHAQGTVVYRWNPGADITGVINRAVAAYTKLRANPLAETVSVDGMTFNTPRDVTKYIALAVRALGLSRTGAA